MDLPTQVLLCLDVDARVDEDEIIGKLPPRRREFRSLRLSQFGAPETRRLDATRPLVDWAGLHNAVIKLAREALRIREESKPPVEFYITGRAPLPVFSLLGIELSSWAGPQTLLNRRQDSSWDILPLNESTSGTCYFDLIEGLHEQHPLDATGTVAVFISAGQAVSDEAIRSFIKQHGEGLAGIVECRSSSAVSVGAQNAALIAEELLRLFKAVQRSYRSSSGIALFVAGPATLAYMAGRACNPKALGSALIANYVPPNRYELAFELPWNRALKSIELSEAPEHQLARLKVWGRIREGVGLLRETLKLEDLPPQLPSNEQSNFLRRLNELKFVEPEGPGLYLSTSTGRMTIGLGLLEVIRTMEEDYWEPFGLLVLLHELFHVEQELTSHNYFGVGRAGVALEEVDYWADAFAAGTLIAHALREGGLRAQRSPSEIMVKWLDSVLRGIEAFDRATSGERLDVLPERRLRRYLIWGLQRARAATVREWDKTWRLFDERLVVELAPLRGHLNEHYDKMVLEAITDTELFVVVGRQMMRFSKRPSFDPGGFIEAVRTFDRSELLRLMEYVIHEKRKELTPWVT